jgi:CRP/FNR family cyclic AMP-dependent transcriptional regulator
VDVRELAGIPLFADLSKKELGAIAGWCDVVDVPAGSPLLKQGSFPHEFFVILDGTVTVERFGEEVATLGPGDFFGEIALLEHEKRTATVVAAKPLKVAVMTARQFGLARAQMPEVAERLERAARARMGR